MPPTPTDEESMQRLPEVELESRLHQEVAEHRAEVLFGAVDRSIAKLPDDYSRAAINTIIDRYIDVPGGEEDIALSAHFARDANMVTAGDRRALNLLSEAVGQQPDYLKNKLLSCDSGETIDVEITEGIRLKLEKRNGTFFSSRIEDDNKSTKQIIDALRGLRDKMEASDLLTKAAKEVSQSYIENGRIGYSDQTLSFNVNPDDVVAHLRRSRFGRENIDTNQWGLESTPKKIAHAVNDIYTKLPFHYPGEVPDKAEGVYFNENGCLQKILLESDPGVYIALRSAEPDSPVSVEELPLQIGVEVVPDEVFRQSLDYEGRSYEDLPAFLETAPAKQLLYAFDAAGLKLSPRLLDTFAEVGAWNSRYGHAYADLTREVAKLVDDQDRSLTHFFDGEDEELASKIRNLGEVEHVAAQTVVGILKQVVDRNYGDLPDGVTELPLSKGRIEIQDGSCKDIEVYAADSKEIPEGVLWKTAYGRPTYITLKPVRLNGIILPPGSLLRGEDDGYLFARITSFAFDENTDRETFGPQYAANTDVRLTPYPQTRSVIENYTRSFATVESETLSRDQILFAPIKTDKKDTDLPDDYIRVLLNDTEPSSDIQDAAMGSNSRSRETVTPQSEQLAEKWIGTIARSYPELYRLITSRLGSNVAPAEIAKSLREDADLRLAVGQELLIKTNLLAKGGELTDQPNRDVNKTPSRGGYKFEGVDKLKSREYVALLALAMLDGTFVEADAPELAEGVDAAQIRDGQHRLAAQIVLSKRF